LKRDAKNLAQRDKRIGWIIGATIVVVLVLAWIDGGEEALHPIEQPVAISGDVG